MDARLSYLLQMLQISPPLCQMKTESGRLKEITKGCVQRMCMEVFQDPQYERT
jgi:hypothetical protein